MTFVIKFVFPVEVSGQSSFATKDLITKLASNFPLGARDVVVTALVTMVAPVLVVVVDQVITPVQ
jgi:hypothetical protein